MSADKSEERRLDEMLGRALREHTEPVPAGFAERMLHQITEDEKQRILARVVMQEKLTLAGCVTVGIIAIVAVATFPNIVGNLTRQVEVFADRISQTVETVTYEWQFRVVFAGLFLFAVYSLVDLLAGDS
jgi:hypothetical protein